MNLVQQAMEYGGAEERGNYNEDQTRIQGVEARENLPARRLRGVYWPHTT